MELFLVSYTPVYLMTTTPQQTSPTSAWKSTGYHLIPWAAEGTNSGNQITLLKCFDNSNFILFIMVTHKAPSNAVQDLLWKWLQPTNAGSRWRTPLIPWQLGEQAKDCANEGLARSQHSHFLALKMCKEQTLLNQHFMWCFKMIAPEADFFCTSRDSYHTTVCYSLG